ncbi:hypothetical protein [Paraburkholderia caledonica]|uniref:hypothetical protein n=1 Tax=Paraburkholderia caledonica TaxID=134536 RepID=UPI0038BA51E9
MQVVELKDDFSSEFLVEFARLIIAFGRLEFLLKVIAKDLHGKGFTLGMAQAELDGQNFAPFCKSTLKQLARERLTERLPAAGIEMFCSLLDEAVGLGEFRNDCVHACWYVHRTGLPARIRPKKNSKESADWSRGRVVQTAEIRAAREQIDRLYSKLDTLRLSWPPESASA